MITAPSPPTTPSRSTVPNVAGAVRGRGSNTPRRALRACVVGAGHIAKQHLACISRLPDVEIVGVCDISPAAAEAGAERFGVPRWFVGHAEMFAAVAPDVVHVTTPVNAHFEAATDALAAGAHVVVEKPIATEHAQVLALLKQAAAVDRILVEDQNYLYNAPVRRLTDLVASGSAGRVIHVEVGICLDLYGPGSRIADRDAPHPALGTAGGAAMEFLTHMACLTVAFLGPHRAVRTSWPKAGLAGGEFRALVEAEAGGTASLLFSGTAQPDEAWIRIHGTKARAEAGLFEPRFLARRLRGGPRPLTPLLNGFAEAAGAARGSFAGLWRKLAGGAGSYDGLWELLTRTYASLREGGEPPVSPRQIEAVSRLVSDLVDGHRTSAAGGETP